MDDQEEVGDIETISSPIFARQYFVYIVLGIPALMFPCFLLLLGTFNRDASRDFPTDRLSRDLQFIFVSDIHYDPQHEPTGTRQTLCRLGDDNHTFAYGKYRCDAPVELIGSFLSHAQNISNPDFIIFGGDVPAHGTHYPMPKIKEEWLDVMEMFNAAFPGVPVYPVIGNNDISPDYGTLETDPGCFSVLADTFTSLTESETETFKKGGYYFHDFDHVRVIFMNSVLYSKRRPKTDVMDPFGQFAWMAKVCQDATAKGLTIGVVMHIPPGVSKEEKDEQWYRQYMHQYHNLVMTYNIKFTLSGHTHHDQLLPTSGDAVRYLLSAPALSPIGSTNPAYRVMTLGSEGIMNYKQYHLDIVNKTSNPEWSLEYEFSSKYGVYDVSPTSVLKAVSKKDTREYLFSLAIRDGALWYCIMISSSGDELDCCGKNRFV